MKTDKTILKFDGNTKKKKMTVAKTIWERWIKFEINETEGCHL